MSWSNVIRVMDYPDLVKYTFQAAAGGTGSGYVDTQVDFDTDWHTYRIYRTVAGTAEFQIDDNPFESLGSPYVPTINLYPWLMSYARTTAPQSRFDVDWIRVRKWCGADTLATVGIEVTIDIKPGSYPNAINLGSKGVIPVAILSSGDFVATSVNPDTVMLGGATIAVRGKGSKLMAHEEDVNDDGLVDLVV